MSEVRAAAGVVVGALVIVASVVLDVVALKVGTSGWYGFFMASPIVVMCGAIIAAVSAAGGLD